MAERNHRNLDGDGSDGERLFTIPEELVEEREEDASESSQSPCAEGEGWEGRIVGGCNGEGLLFDRRIG